MKEIQAEKNKINELEKRYFIFFKTMEYDLQVRLETLAVNLGKMELGKQESRNNQAQMYNTTAASTQQQQLQGMTSPDLTSAKSIMGKQSPMQQAARRLSNTSRYGGAAESRI